MAPSFPDGDMSRWITVGAARRVGSRWEACAPAVAYDGRSGVAGGTEHNPRHKSMKRAAVRRR